MASTTGHRDQLLPKLIPNATAHWLNQEHERQHLPLDGGDTFLEYVSAAESLLPTQRFTGREAGQEPLAPFSLDGVLSGASSSAKSLLGGMRGVVGGTDEDPTVSVRIQEFAALEEEEDAEVVAFKDQTLQSKSSFRDITEEDRREIFADSPRVATDRIIFEETDESRQRVKQTQKSVSLNDFELLKIIGKGAFGKVFLARKKNNNRLYAMKVLRKATLTVHTKSIEHTKNERSILERIQHPFIAKLWYAFQSPARLFLILEYAPGGELFSHLAAERMFSEDVAAFYIGELLLALEHLHSLGIIYRDLKPENVLLDAQGHVILTDFGLSKWAVKTETMCGTIEFTAPEVLDPKVRYGYGVDHWSLGVMLYDMLTGNPPFTGQNRKKIMDAILTKKPNFPFYLTSFAKDLLTRLLRKDPEKRIGSGPTRGAEIQAHSFFRKINWNNLAKRRTTPPIKPSIVDPLDTSNFDECFTSMPVLLDSPPQGNRFLPLDPDGEMPSTGSMSKKKKKKKAQPNHVVQPTTAKDAGPSVASTPTSLTSPALGALTFTKSTTLSQAAATSSAANGAGSLTPSLLRRGIEALNMITGVPASPSDRVPTPVSDFSGSIASASATPKLGTKTLECSSDSNHVHQWDQPSPRTKVDGCGSVGIPISPKADKDVSHFQGFTYVASDDELHDWGSRRRADSFESSILEEESLD
ncbi:kinase-like domain-containing protein [Zopfochytrium polystomum]|nr:kinase-like domain-containing protein [Zopfochytrium polystomum]